MNAKIVMLIGTMKDPIHGSDCENISSEGHHSCGTTGGKLYCWGYNANGELGDGTVADKSVPTQIGVRTDWSDISSGIYHTCGKINGELYCWGYNGYGQLGDGTAWNENPSPVQNPRD